MIDKNYLSTDTNNSLPNYSKRDSYLSETILQTNKNEYAILPEEYNIFSKIEDVSFDDSNIQHRFVSKCLYTMKNILLNYCKIYEVRNVLPKIHYTQEEDQTINLTWSYSNYQVFLSFESSEAIAYCGILYKQNDDDISTEVKKITEHNYQEVIENIMRIMINN